MNCYVKGCENRDDNGKGRDLEILYRSGGGQEQIWICDPCWKFLTSGKGSGNSRLERNIVANNSSLNDEKLNKLEASARADQW